MNIINKKIFEKRVVIVLVFFLLAVFLSPIFLASSREYSKADKGVISSLDAEGKAEVIVVLKQKVDKEGYVRAAASSSKEKVEKNFNSFNGFSATLDEAEIKKLDEDKNVEKIYLNRKVSAHLQDSARIINASLIWPSLMNELNLTGKGQTICIIDTGINYNHPDLGGCYGNNNATSTCKVLGGWDYVNSDSDPLDDNGHGTHVAGIAAANGSITGIAPGAKLIAIKSLNSAGSGSDSNILAGIDWCVSNSATYNITVISMSLGIRCDVYPEYCYNNYCDGEPAESLYAVSINAAAAKNISVIAASGNENNYTAMSSPGCLSNSTPVASSDKSDNFLDYSNRNLNLRLVAPGGTSNSQTTGINSTSYTLGYVGKYGTSMAAPHVAGAFAIMRQYIDSVSIKKTPKQMEAIFNNTGKRLTDAVSGLSFTRINIYSAVDSIQSPLINFTSGGDSSGANLRRNYILVNVTAYDAGVVNISAYLYNSTGIVNSTNTNKSRFYFNFSSLRDGTYFFNATTCDSFSNCNSTETRNVTLDSTFPSINFTTPSENSGALLVQNSFVVNVTSNDSNFANLSVSLFNSTKARVNFTTTSQKDIYINFSSLNDGTYFFNATACDSFSNCNSTETRNITLDLNIPVISLISPMNNSWINLFNLTISVDQASACWVEFNNTNLTMLSYGISNFYYFNASQGETSNRTHNATFYCNSSFGEINNSQLVFFGIDSTAPNVSLGAPADAYSTTSSSVTFYYTPWDNNSFSSCSLIIDGNLSASSSSIISGAENSILKDSISVGTHTWAINCTDSAGNKGNSSSKTIVIQSPPVDTPSGSGGGGGGGAPPKRPANIAAVVPTGESSQSAGPAVIPAQMEKIASSEGYTEQFVENEKINFYIETSVESAGAQEVFINESHTLLVNQVSNNSVNITIRSDPINLVLQIGEEKKLNLTSPKYYDLYLKLNSIENNSANLTIKTIKENIQKTAIEKAINFAKEYKIWIIIAIIILALIIINDIVEYRWIKKAVKSPKKK